VFKRVAKKYIEEIVGWQWIATMSIGSGCRVHVKADELPNNDTIILNLSKHFACVKNGELYDIFDCSREGTRCVYGYWKAPQNWSVETYNKNKAKVLNQ
jgi:hypothetical protein